MAIDNFGPARIDPQEQKQWQAQRLQAFFEAALIKHGLVQTADIIEVLDGKLNAVVDRLGIEPEFKAAVERLLENNRVNAPMDKADAPVPDP